MNSTPKKLTAYEISQKQQAESRERDRKFQDEVRERAKRTADTVAEQDAQEAREREAATEVSFRVDELAKYLAAGGKEANFNSDWPRLRQQIVEARYLSNRTESPNPKSQAQKHLDLHYKRGA